MNQYDQAFKEEAIRLAISSSQPLSKTARDLKIKESTLYKWVSDAKSKSFSVANSQDKEINLFEELKRLRKENMRLKEERDILKKAAAYFAKDAK